MQLTDAVVVVTGAAGGIGRALVAAFVTAGARAVVAHDRDRAAVEEVATSHAGAATTVIARSGDVASPHTIAELTAFAEEQLGHIDLFCSNAGVMLTGGVEVDEARWAEAWAVNVMAHVQATKCALPGMLRRGSGHFLNVCSAAGMLTAPGAAAYATTKHAALGLAEWLAITYGDRGIGVHVVCPEAVDTAMLRGSLSDDNEGVRRVAERSLVVDAATVAAAVVDGLAHDRFLILSHPDTLKNTQRKWADPERWIGAMRSFLRAR